MLDLRSSYLGWGGVARLEFALGAVALVILANCAEMQEQAASAPPAVRASRLFAGPEQYPPEDFAAYGILAFRSGATSQSEQRYLAICEGFLAGLPAAAELANRDIPLEEQMATVWPLDDVGLANHVNGTNPDSVPRELCGDIVTGIDLITSLDAIAMAEMAASEGESFDGAGPYLIAWSPSTDVGQPDVPVLIWDLSDVTTIEEATRQFVDWADEIVENPDLWRDGWGLDRLRATLRQWADKYGPAILRVFNLGEV